MLSASQLPDATGTEKKAFVMAQLEELNVPGYDEEVASMAVDIAVKVYKCEETKRMILGAKTCCKRRFFQ